MTKWSTGRPTGQAGRFPLGPESKRFSVQSSRAQESSQIPSMMWFKVLAQSMLCARQFPCDPLLLAAWQTSTKIRYVLHHNFHNARPCNLGLGLGWTGLDWTGLNGTSAQAHPSPFQTTSAALAVAAAAAEAAETEAEVEAETQAVQGNKTFPGVNTH